MRKREKKSAQSAHWKAIAILVIALGVGWSMAAEAAPTIDGEVYYDWDGSVYQGGLDVIADASGNAYIYDSQRVGVGLGNIRIMKYAVGGGSPVWNVEY